MRTFIMDPLYKMLNTLAEKKAAWQKVISSDYACLWLGYLLTSWGLFIVHRWLEAKEQEEREVRPAKLRPSIRNLLEGSLNVHPIQHPLLSMSSL